MKSIQHQLNVKVISCFCAILLFVAVLKLPIEYYTLLRVIIFIGALLIILSTLNNLIWVLIFSIIAILFNPIIPVYLYIKPYWIPIDIISGLLFLITLFFDKPQKDIKKLETKGQKEFRRDKIY